MKHLFVFKSNHYYLILLILLSFYLIYYKFHSLLKLHHVISYLCIIQLSLCLDLFVFHFDYFKCNFYQIQSSFYFFQCFFQAIYKDSYPHKTYLDFYDCITDCFYDIVSNHFNSKMANFEYNLIYL